MQRRRKRWFGFLFILACLESSPITAMAAGADDTDEQLRVSDPVSIANGRMVVLWKPEQLHSQNVLLHFHGAPGALKKPFLRSRINAVLVVVTFPGLSRAYSEPFQRDKELFNKILVQARAMVGGESGQTDADDADGKWDTTWLSSFSAGYGAVREILKMPDDFDRIQGIVAADSIYAGIDDSAGRREVNPQDMHDFLRFAKFACDRQVTFVLSHSSLQTSYASTVETADYLIDKLYLRREPDRTIQRPDLKQTSRATKGQFAVLGFAGTTGPDHMQHLHQIDLYWKRLIVAP